MDNKQRHLYADYICVVMLFIGFILFAFKPISIFIGASFVGAGLFGMIINEKVNPFEEIAK